MEQPQETTIKQPSKLKGRKCEPKYRGPNGELWSGRGKMARWIKESGQDKEAFKIPQAA